MSLSRRTSSLARTFRIVSLAALGPALLTQCSSSGATSGGGDDASIPDATASTPEASSGGDDGATAVDGSDAARDAATSDANDASDAGSCWATVNLLDATGPDGEEICEFAMPCGLANSQLTSTGCVVVPADVDGAPADAAGTGFPLCTLLEGAGCTDGSYDPPEAGVTFDCIGCPGGGGRRPAGLVTDDARARDAIGAWCARMAWLEAASVRAFDELAAELEAHGAPPALIDAARSSARDEAGHARVMARLARRFGAAPRAPRVVRTARRSLASLARANAVEGCVRETYGALVNAVQARRARDPEVRAAMEAIARDELRHAALSWEIDAWAGSRLSPRERAAIARAKRRSAARLAAEVARDAPTDLRDRCGLPDAREASSLVRGLAERLWAA